MKGGWVVALQLKGEEDPKKGGQLSRQLPAEIAKL